MTDDTKAGRWSRWAQGAALTLLFAFLGLVAGTAVGAGRVPDGSGLAGPAIALGYGLTLSVAAFLAGLAIAARGTPSVRRRSLVAAATLALLALGWIALRVRAISGTDPSSAPDAPTQPAKVLPPSPSAFLHSPSPLAGRGLPQASLRPPGMSMEV